MLIDSAPGLSILTECWLREVDFYLSPTKPDYISTHGLQFLGQFSQRDTDMGFAECLGVIISMKDKTAFEDAQYERWLRQNSKHPCFDQVIPRATSLQTAAHFCPRPSAPTGRSIRARPARRCASSRPSCWFAPRPRRRARPIAKDAPPSSPAPLG